MKKTKGLTASLRVSPHRRRGDPPGEVRSMPRLPQVRSLQHLRDPSLHDHGLRHGHVRVLPGLRPRVHSAAGLGEGRPVFLGAPASRRPLFSSSALSGFEAPRRHPHLRLPRREIEERGVVRKPQAGNPVVQLADLEPAKIYHVPEPASRDATQLVPAVRREGHPTLGDYRVARSCGATLREELQEVEGGTEDVSPREAARIQLCSQEPGAPKGGSGQQCSSQVSSDQASTHKVCFREIDAGQQGHTEVSAM
jgi:hypothetical protein